MKSWFLSEINKFVNLLLEYSEETMDDCYYQYKTQELM